MERQELRPVGCSCFDTITRWERQASMAAIPPRSAPTKKPRRGGLPKSDSGSWNRNWTVSVAKLRSLEKTELLGLTIRQLEGLRSEIAKGAQDIFL